MKEIDEKILKQLQKIGKDRGWDEIYLDKATIGNKPVFTLRNSTIPKGAKTGYPHMYKINDYGNVVELSIDEIHYILTLKTGLGYKIQ